MRNNTLDYFGKDLEWVYGNYKKWNNRKINKMIMMKNFRFICLLILGVLLFSCGEREDSNSSKLNVMSFNIRYDNPEDGDNNWKFRKDVAAQIVKNQNIDLLGTQEVLENQREDLIERLPDYEVRGVGREDSIHKGEHSAIFYKKSRFKELDNGNFWLSETPDTVSIGWDAALERIATWVKLKDKENGKEFLFMNTHLDHMGKKARRKSAEMLLDSTAQISNGGPIILSGDFNGSPSSSPYKLITDEDNERHLNDSPKRAEDVEEAEGTFHAFGKIPDKNRDRIDFIFINKQVEALKYESMPEKLDDIYLSDHIPIVAHLKLK